MASLRHAIARHAPDRAERFEALFRDAHPREEGN
jgi:hypothetical protein